MEQTPFQVNLSGIIKILSDNLYSCKDVFIRELFQNAIDAITARKKEDQFDPKISIEYFENLEGGGIILTDNGIGLNKEQIEVFLARIGASSKSMDKLNDMRSDFIGQFGIGLLSCFMVSDDIVVITTSLHEQKTYKWTGNIEGTYKIESVDKTLPLGTKVILKLRKDIEMPKEHFQDTVKLYGKHLNIPIEIEVNGRFKETINSAFPWELSQQGDASLVEGEKIFEEKFHNYLVLKDPKTNKKYGILYLLPRPSHTTNPTSALLYVKRMFVTEYCRDVLPDWAVFVRAIINSESLSLNASRESIYSDEALDQLKENIAHSIKEYFYHLSMTSPKILSRIINTHNMALRQIAIEDPHFLKFIYKWFTFQTTHGTLNLETIKKHHKVIYYVIDVDEFRQIVPIGMANNKLVINAGYYYDAILFNEIARIDLECDYIEIDAGYFGMFLGDIAIEDYEIYQKRFNTLQNHLDKYQCKIELKNFDPENIPAIYHSGMDLIEARDIKEIQESSGALWSSISEIVYNEPEDNTSRIYMNMKNKTIETLFNHPNAHDKSIIEMIYINAMLLGHYPLNQIELEAMNLNLKHLIEKAFFKTRE